MTDRPESAAQLLNRRSFITRAAAAVGAVATLAAMTQNLPFSPFKKSSGSLSSVDSIFTPRVGSRLNYWRSRLDRFRLR